MFHILHLLIWLRALSYLFREKSSADLGKIKVEMNLLNDSELCILTAAQTRKLNSSRRRQCRTSRRSRSKARQRGLTFGGAPTAAKSHENDTLRSTLSSRR